MKFHRRPAVEARGALGPASASTPWPPPAQTRRSAPPRAKISARPRAMLSAGWAGLVLSFFGMACQAEKPHEKAFFACDAQRPVCPKEQFCNSLDLCCHSKRDGPMDNLGHCKLIPDGATGLSSSGGLPGSTAPKSAADDQSSPQPQT